MYFELMFVVEVGDHQGGTACIYQIPSERSGASPSASTRKVIFSVLFQSTTSTFLGRTCGSPMQFPFSCICRNVL